MVVEVKVDVKVLAEGGELQSFQGSKQFGSLLCEHPRGAREEANAHLLGPDTNEVGAPRAACSISIVPWSRGQWRLWEVSVAPSRQCHGKSFQGGSSEVGGGAGCMTGTITQGSIWACQKGEDATAWCGKPDELSQQATGFSSGIRASGKG